MNRFLIITLLILLGIAYCAGYWPQHKQLLAAEQSAAQAQQQLADAQAVTRLCHLENELLDLVGQTESRNYGNATNLSNTFFDDLRKESDQDQNVAYKSDLDSMLAQRDVVTAGLARADASTANALHQMLGQMQQIMHKLAA
jgi:hypothetical protein